jgi:hypothetical protein
MSEPVLTYRQLNRATLARQFLLARDAEIGIPGAIAHLLGSQGQQSHDPYIGLWSRLAGFRHEDLTALIVGRTLARATTMRGTLHLHTADDLIGIRAIVQPELTKVWNGNFKRRFGSEDKEKALRAGRNLLDTKPMTAGQLNKAMHPKFPTAELLALSTLLQLHETLVQIPPTRIWGNSAAPLLTPVENWLPPPYERPISREELVLRYLRSYGPASVADMTTWGRITALGKTFEALRDRLVTFRDETGKVLFDLPDGLRPDEHTPAPVRFLPLYDNAYLGYANRRRMLSEHTAHLINLFQNFKPAVLIDGMVNAGWAIADSKAGSVIDIECYRTLTRSETRELKAEAEAFLVFMRPEAKSRAVTLSGVGP